MTETTGAERPTLPDWLRPGCDVYVHSQGIDFYSGPALPGRVTAADPTTGVVTVVTILEDRPTPDGGHVTRTSEPREFRWESEHWWRSHSGEEPYTTHFTLYHPHGRRAAEERIRSAKKRIAAAAETLAKAYRNTLDEAISELAAALAELNAVKDDQGNGMP